MDYYNEGFGYDQIFVNPAFDFYRDDKETAQVVFKNESQPISQLASQQSYDRLANHAGQHERFTDNRIPPRTRIAMPTRKQESSATTCGNSSVTCSGTYCNNIKQKLIKYKYQNDMMFIFITFLFLIIIIQWSMRMNAISHLAIYHPAAYSAAYQPSDIESPYITYSK